MNEFDDMTDDQLRDFEESLYDDEVAGVDVWPLRDRVLWEMNRRHIFDGVLPLFHRNPRSAALGIPREEEPWHKMNRL
jgi:hypothetical protein